MSAIEQRARELLAAEYEKRPDSLARKSFAAHLRSGDIAGFEEEIAAIIAALTPPESWVLVPVEPTEAMKRSFNGYRPIGRANFACRYKEMLAARPEVKS